MQSKRKEIKLLILALFILLGIAFVKLALFPLYNERDRLENDNSQILANIERLEKSKFDRKRENQNRRDQDLMIMIPMEPQLSQLFTDIDKVAEESKVFLLGAYFSDQERRDGQNNPVKKTLNISAQGSFSNLILLIKTLEANPRLLVIKKIIFTRQINELTEIESAGITNDEAVNRAGSYSESISRIPDQHMVSTDDNKLTYKIEMQIDYFYLPEAEAEAGNSGENK